MSSDPRLKGVCGCANRTLRRKDSHTGHLSTAQMSAKAASGVLDESTLCTTGLEAKERLGGSAMDMNGTISRPYILCLQSLVPHYNGLNFVQTAVAKPTNVLTPTGKARSSIRNCALCPG